MKNERKFETDLMMLINKHNIENGSATPDHILATYIVNMIKVFNSTMLDRQVWYGDTPPFEIKSDE